LRESIAKYQKSIEENQEIVSKLEQDLQQQSKKLADHDHDIALLEQEEE